MLQNIKEAVSKGQPFYFVENQCVIVNNFSYIFDNQTHKMIIFVT